MKVQTVFKCATAMLALTPFHAQAADEPIQHCMDAFAAQNFPNSHVTFVVDDESSGLFPLVAQSGTQLVQLVARDKASGRVLATSACKVKEVAAREGKVILMPLGDR